MLDRVRATGGKMTCASHSGQNSRRPHWDDLIWLLIPRDSDWPRPPARAATMTRAFDTGLHTKHWTRQQAIDYGIEASEVERYVVLPGQAAGCGQKVMCRSEEHTSEL